MLARRNNSSGKSCAHRQPCPNRQENQWAAPGANRQQDDTSSKADGIDCQECDLERREIFSPGGMLLFSHVHDRIEVSAERPQASQLNPSGVPRSLPLLREVQPSPIATLLPIDRSGLKGVRRFRSYRISLLPRHRRICCRRTRCASRSRELRCCRQRMSTVCRPR